MSVVESQAGPSPHDAEPDNPPILAVERLRTQFPTRQGLVKAVDDISFRILRGETLAVVGESGSGKSVMSLSIMRLAALSGGVITSGRMNFRRRDGQVIDLASEPESAMRRVRGNEIAMIFQEPMTSLDPVHSVGNQIAEAVRLHQKVGRAEAFEIAVRMLEHVGIPSPASRAHDFPHQMSGGMRQRVMIAMALCCNPSLLIADEPTTALDVTIQAQILDLIHRMQAERNMSGSSPTTWASWPASRTGFWLCTRAGSSRKPMSARCFAPLGIPIRSASWVRFRAWTARPGSPGGPKLG